MKRLIYDDYLDYLNKYRKSHGDNTTVLMQVGGFFEIYAIEDDKEVKPAMEPQEYEVGEKPERFDFKE